MGEERENFLARAEQAAKALKEHTPRSPRSHAAVKPKVQWGSIVRPAGCYGDFVHASSYCPPSLDGPRRRTQRHVALPIHGSQIGLECGTIATTASDVGAARARHAVDFSNNVRRGLVKGCGGCNVQRHIDLPNRLQLILKRASTCIASCRGLTVRLRHAMNRRIKPSRSFAKENRLAECSGGLRCRVSGSSLGVRGILAVWRHAPSRRARQLWPWLRHLGSWWSELRSGSAVLC
eukprot:7377176-Prymnesium_polylepis.2